MRTLAPRERKIRPNELGLTVEDENVGLGRGLVSPLHSAWAPVGLPPMKIRVYGSGWCPRRAQRAGKPRRWLVRRREGVFRSAMSLRMCPTTAWILKRLLEPEPPLLTDARASEVPPPASLVCFQSAGTEGLASQTASFKRGRSNGEFPRSGS